MAATNLTWLNLSTALLSGHSLSLAQTSPAATTEATPTSPTSPNDDLQLGETRVLIEIPESFEAEPTTALPDLQLSDTLMIAGIALMAFMLLLNLRKRLKADANKLKPREQIEQTRQHQGMRDDLNQMMIELEALARRFGAQLDAKAIELEQLIDEAETAAQQLRNLKGNEPKPPRVVSVSAASANQTESTSAHNKTKTPSSPRSRITTPPRSSNSNQQSTDNDNEATLARVIRAEAGGDDPLRRRVYELADNGSTPIQIAQGLNEDVGKVELILALRAG